MYAKFSDLQFFRGKFALKAGCFEKKVEAPFSCNCNVKCFLWRFCFEKKVSLSCELCAIFVFQCLTVIEMKDAREIPY